MFRSLTGFISFVVLSYWIGDAVAGEAVKVSIADLVFRPAAVTVHVGDTVEWLNGDFVDHTATAKNGDWDVEILAGKSSRLDLTKEGTIDYFCRFHPAMKGTIHVVGGAR